MIDSNALIIGLGASLGVNVALGIYCGYYATKATRLLQSENHLTDMLNVSEANIKCLMQNVTDLEADLEEAKSVKKERPQSIEVKEFLTDLMTGGALIAVNRVNADNMFTYSPKDA